MLNIFYIGSCATFCSMFFKINQDFCSRNCSSSRLVQFFFEISEVNLGIISKFEILEIFSLLLIFVVGWGGVGLGWSRVELGLSLVGLGWAGDGMGLNGVGLRLGLGLGLGLGGVG